jgi:hypothetical protein
MAARKRHDVVNMPPPWKRSLTESGMSRRVTLLDRLVVALFAVLFVALAAWIVGGGVL